jgi:septal ring factor EnvC (AmiA/AmiB activator)
VSYHYGFLVETLVSILLLLTILYCVRLNKQLRLLKADEQSLRATISELITATEIAERAIGGLKSTMREGEQTLNERLNRSEQMSTDIERQLKAGEELLAKITRIAGAGRPAEELVAAVPDAKSVAAAAQAFAERTRARLSGQSSGHSNGLAA